MATNPFTPTFGISPPLLAGRHAQLRAFEQALERGPGSPGLVTLYVGVRGTGKTVLLNEVEDLASSRGWVVISETATDGLVDRLVDDQLPRAMRNVEMTDDDLTVTGVGMFGVSARWQTTRAEVAPSLRSLLTDLAVFQEKRGSGVLLTVDEIHAGSSDDLRQLAAALQHCVREGRWVSLGAAGLPAAIKGLLNDDVVTFLRRADRHDIGSIDPLAVERAIKVPIIDAGRTIDPSTVVAAADATGGYGFMIQLVGYYLWEVSGDQITDADIAPAIDLAQRRVATLMLEPTLEDLSPSARRYLMAMSLDDGVSRSGEVAERMGLTTKGASMHRDKLLATGIISAPGHGLVDLEVPYLREHLRRNPIALD